MTTQLGSKTPWDTNSDKTLQTLCREMMERRSVTRKEIIYAHEWQHIAFLLNKTASECLARASGLGFLIRVSTESSKPLKITVKEPGSKKKNIPWSEEEDNELKNWVAKLWPLYIDDPKEAFEHFKEKKLWKGLSDYWSSEFPNRTHSSIYHRARKFWDDLAKDRVNVFIKP